MFDVVVLATVEVPWHKVEHTSQLSTAQMILDAFGHVLCFSLVSVSVLQR
jgi:hypothetical protein